MVAYHLPETMYPPRLGHGAGAATQTGRPVTGPVIGNHLVPAMDHNKNRPVQAPDIRGRPVSFA